jgi:gliding motility-associated-like protein
VVPADGSSTVECLANATTPTPPTVVDVCGTSVAAVLASTVDSPDPLTCEGTRTYNYTYTDCAGLVSNWKYTYTIDDTTAPVLAAAPAPVTIQCIGDLPPMVSLAFTDNCDTAGTQLGVDANQVGGNCGGTITRTWNVSDACGNPAITRTQIITIQDTKAPTTTTAFATRVDVTCDEIPLKPELVFVDNCSAVTTPVYTEEIINQSADSYSIMREWNVSDTCGNPSKFTQEVNVTIENGVIRKDIDACNSDSALKIDLNTLLPVGSPTNGTWVDINNSGGLQNNIFSPLNISVGDYTLEYRIDNPTCPRSIFIDVTITDDCDGIVLGCGAVVVHNAFTPNNDGKNELFIIDNINDTECYPENTVEIYNRWGVLVFETKNYNNTTNVFDGTSRGRTTVKQSEGLPTGTYFYLVNYTSKFSINGVDGVETNKINGYLYLSR